MAIELTFSVNNQPSWADFAKSSGALSGQPALGSVGTYASIEISVSDGKARSALPKFAISVDQVGTISTTLSWTPPTQNEDGSALMDLAWIQNLLGHNTGPIHTLGEDRKCWNVILCCREPDPPAPYEFAATSFNDAGVESAYSNPATRVLN